MPRRAVFSLLGAVLALGLAAAPAPDARPLVLAPGSARVLFMVRAFGIWPIHGRFSRFHGQVNFDPANSGQCQVEMSIDLTSLQMIDPAMQDDVLSPALLNAAAFPDLLYRGACAGADAVEGLMTLHGVTHPLRLMLHEKAGEWVAEGRFQRAAWGITGRPLLAGPEVQVRVVVTMPPP